jgi:hypothetical protein
MKYLNVNQEKCMKFVTRNRQHQRKYKTAGPHRTAFLLLPGYLAPAAEDESASKFGRQTFSFRNKELIINHHDDILSLTNNTC